METTFVSKRKMNVNITVLIFPVFFLISFVVLFILSSKTAYTKISSQLKSIKEIDTKNGAIEAKIEELRNIKTESFPDSEIILTSFPEDDPSLWMLTQLRRKSEEYSLFVENQKVSFSSPDTEIVSSNISFDLIGDVSNIIKFLLDLDKV